MEPPSTPNFDSLPNPNVGWIFFLTAEDDPTIDCSQLVEETSVLVGREKSLGGGNHPLQ